MANTPYYTHGSSLKDREYFTSTVKTPRGLKRYFSTIDAEVYFGETYIDDIARLDFQVEEIKMPIYGYNSYTADRIIAGKKVIQGTFAVNFTSAGHITNVVNSISDSLYSSELEKTIVNDDAKNTPIWSKGFDILIGYGYYKHPDEKNKSYNATVQCLTGVYINGVQQLVDASGDPIMEVYSFVAKDLIFKDTSTISKKQEITNEGTGTKEDVESVSYKFIDVKNDTNSTRVAELYEYCKQNPETVGISLGLKHNVYKDSQDIRLEISVYQDKPVNIKSIKLEINDQRVKNAPVLTMKKYANLHYTYNFTDEMMTYGNDIKKALTDLNTQGFVSCRLVLEIIKDGEEKASPPIKEYVNIYRGSGYK
jgi:hypothetical protein